MPKKTGEDLAQAGKNTILYVALIVGAILLCAIACGIRY